MGMCQQVQHWHDYSTLPEHCSLRTIVVAYWYDGNDTIQYPHRLYDELSPQLRLGRDNQVFHKH